jgi:hypothetical protein
VVDGLGDGCWAGVLALDDIFARGLLVCPQDGLWHSTLQGIRHRGDTVAVDRQDDKVVLLLGLLRYGQAEDLVNVLAGNGKLDLASSIDGTDTAVSCIE